MNYPLRRLRPSADRADGFTFFCHLAVAVAQCGPLNIGWNKK
jgi:hypothetical protein